MALFNSLNTSASGMTAQRVRTDIIAQNIANVNTTRDENGNVYRRKNVIFEEISSSDMEARKLLKLSTKRSLSIFETVFSLMMSVVILSRCSL